MAKKRLEWASNTEFQVYSIYASIKLYRLAWLFNDNLKTNFCRVEDLEIPLSKSGSLSEHHAYIFENEEEEWRITLVQNKGTNLMLVKHNPSPLALLKIKGELGLAWANRMVSFCKNSKEILLHKQLDTNQLSNLDLITYYV